MRAYWANTSLNLEPENKDETSALELLLKIFRSGMNPGTTKKDDLQFVDLALTNHGSKVLYIHRQINTGNAPWTLNADHNRFIRLKAVHHLI